MLQHATSANLTPHRHPFDHWSFLGNMGLDHKSKAGYIPERILGYALSVSQELDFLRGR